MLVMKLLHFNMMDDKHFITNRYKLEMLRIKDTGFGYVISRIFNRFDMKLLIYWIIVFTSKIANIYLK